MRINVAICNQQADSPLSFSLMSNLGFGTIENFMVIHDTERHF